MYKCQSGYTIRKIKDTCYLLPYGRQVADQRKGLILNETGTLLWNLLQHNEGMTAEELINDLARIYQLESSFFPILRKDVLDFLTQLKSMGMIVEDLHPVSDLTSAHLRIAKLYIQFYDPQNLLLSHSAFTNFKAFCFKPDTASDNKADQRFEFLTVPPSSHAYGEVLLKNSEMTIYENPEHYVVLFHPMKNLYEAHMTKDGSYVRIYCRPESSDTASENIFHAIRLFFLFIAQKKGLFAIHSASLLYQQKAWLFSGHSGAGKSTHTAFWNQLFQTQHLNGDLNLLGVDTENNHIVVYGIPWCGTSKIFTSKTYELGGIVLLGQHPSKNHFEELNESEQILRVMQRMISPAWKEEQLSLNLMFSEEIVSRVPVFYFLCMPKPSSAQMLKARIDLLEDNDLR